MEKSCVERDLVLDRLIELLKAEYGADEITAESSFVSLGIESLDMAQLVLDAEEAFGVEILDDDLAKLGTIADLATYIEAHRG